MKYIKPVGIKTDRHTETWLRAFRRGLTKHYDTKVGHKFDIAK